MGVVLINEPESSFILKLLQIILDDESWSLEADVFNKKKIFLIQKILGFLIQLLLNLCFKIKINFKNTFLNIG